MDSKLIRTAALVVVVFAAGFIAGQLSMSAHVKAAAEAAHLALIEGTVRTDDSLRFAIGRMTRHPRESLSFLD